MAASLLARLANTPGWWAMCEEAAWELGCGSLRWLLWWLWVLLWVLLWVPEEPLLLLLLLLRTPLVGMVSEGTDAADWLRYMWEGPDEEVV